MKKKTFKYPKVYLYAAAIGLLAIVAQVCYFLFASLSKCEEVQYVCIDTDDTMDSVMAKLEPFSAKPALKTFHIISRHAGYANNIHTGRYKIEPGDGAITVYRRLSGGQQEPIDLTVPEARTMPRLAALLSKKLMLDSTTIAQSLTDSIFCAKYEADTATIACLFIPNTYNIYWDTTLDDLMQRMQRERNDFWTPDRRQKAEAIGLTPDEVGRIMENIPEDTMVLIDEAYASFISKDTAYIAPLVNKYNNLIISRTLSKFYGLPGLRCGFGFIGKGHDQFLSYVNKYLGYNRFSEAVALAALESDDHYRHVADDMEWGRQLYKKELGNLPGFKVYKSVANFILIKYPIAIKEALMEALKIQDYKIKFMGDKGLEECLRITLGRKEQTQVVCDTIKKCYEEYKK